MTRRPGDVLDDLFEAVAHDFLEDHALADDVVAVAALEQGLFDAGEAAAQQADDEVVVDVGLGAFGAAAVEVLQQGDEAGGDLGAHVTGGGDGVQIALVVGGHGTLLSLLPR